MGSSKDYIYKLNYQIIRRVLVVQVVMFRSVVSSDYRFIIINQVKILFNRTNGKK